MISVFEREHFLSDAQAGFRPEEECVGQVGALIEINQRWTTKSQEKKAFACFIDFKKAYDMVPHESSIVV